MAQNDVDFCIDATPGVGEVQWEVDAANSSDDGVPAIARNPKRRKIPSYDDPDEIEEIFPKTFPARVPATERNSRVEELMKKSVIGPGFEQQHSVPTSLVSRKALRRDRKKDREMTKGPGWFNLPIQEMTEEVKNDLDLLQMRSVLDPRHHYKKNDLNHTPKYFQVGTVLETPADFYNGRIPKAQRKRTLLSELMADAETSAYQKKKFKSIVDTSRRKERVYVKGKSKPKNLKKKKEEKPSEK